MGGGGLDGGSAGIGGGFLLPNPALGFGFGGGLVLGGTPDGGEGGGECSDCSGEWGGDGGSGGGGGGFFDLFTVLGCANFEPLVLADAFDERGPTAVDDLTGCFPAAVLAFLTVAVPTAVDGLLTGSFASGSFPDSVAVAASALGGRLQTNMCCSEKLRWGRTDSPSRQKSSPPIPALIRSHATRRAPSALGGLPPPCGLLLLCGLLSLCGLLPLDPAPRASEPNAASSAARDTWMNS